MQTNHETAVDAYLTKLKAVLMQPDHGDGNWPDITTEQLCEMDGLIEEMLALKCTHHLLWNYPLINDCNSETAEEEKRRLLGNLRSINGAIGSYNEALRLILRSITGAIGSYHEALRLISRRLNELGDGPNN